MNIISHNAQFILKSDFILNRILSYGPCDVITIGSVVDSSMIFCALLSTCEFFDNCLFLDLIVGR